MQYSWHGFAPYSGTGKSGGEPIRSITQFIQNIIYTTVVNQKLSERKRITKTNLYTQHGSIASQTKQNTVKKYI